MTFLILYYFLFNFATHQVLTTQSLSNRLYQGRSELQADSQVDDSNECFNLYLTKLQTVADQWAANYADCYQNADSKRYDFVEQLKNDQININDSSDDVCNYIKNCKSMKDSLDYFQCFGNLSQNVVTTIYSISNNASDDALLLTEQLQGVNTDLYICTNNTQREYVEQTTDIFNALDACLVYGSNDENIQLGHGSTTIEETENESAAFDGTVESSTNGDLEHTTLHIMSV